MRSIAEMLWTDAAQRATLPRMGHAAARTGLSEQEYLAFERASPERHEYADGEIVPMSSSAAEHSAVCLNLIGELRSALSGRTCRAFESNLRLRIAATGRYVDADGSVVYGRPEFFDDERDALLNPRLIVEVFSSSTEAYDRGEKFEGYRTIPSFEEYVLASQKKPLIEVFTRQSDGSWALRMYGPGQRVELPSAGCAIDVDRVYEGVFEQGA